MTQTFRELDEAAARPKGSAFRAFKRIEPQLREGVDFRLLRASADDTEIEVLRHGQRVYPNSVNIVLLGDAVARRLLKDLCDTPVADE